MVRFIYLVVPDGNGHSDQRTLVSVITGEAIVSLPERVAKLNEGRKFWSGMYKIERAPGVLWNELPG